ncbi:MAG: hypothetical protein DSO07_04650 [Thermoproteota archaeon]|jgi:putative hydrolase of the HAD superfamily|uniref:HAD family hydrolase n=1 Tax=Candidatus Methanodesulfokora washburnensis TaxID=2478471 RepID=A0A3R9PBJ8_9CREN|nr:HAD hydrolase-like protein [Candidatus Methanodesulfokores washburnensis]RSN71526.1 hypothetical protein D6D85_15810 [Candidatus Methanodesulfokores washburnensis]RZN62301.1 MAG: hypothetical protein EF810_03205 [Candidatus Methanodesulfokores washburnensis]TDA41419.1 MAG: hypothetical protein DSO07_04650 [Candidatus Korarchaeota archaeon]
MRDTVVFDLDDVLFDATFLKRVARERAVLSMIDAGLPVDFETAIKALFSVIEETGEDYGKHFDEMLEKLGIKWDPRIIAAGVVAYHNTKFSLLEPNPGIFKVILSLRDEGFRVGVASIGPAVKDWEKLIRLNLHHIFHIYKVGLSSWSELFQELDPSTTILVSANPSGIAEASRAGARTVRLLRGRFSHIRSKEADREVKDIWGILSAVKSLSEGL